MDVMDRVANVLLGSRGEYLLQSLYCGESRTR